MSSSSARLLALIIAMVTMSSGSMLTPVLPTLKAHFGLSGTAVALVVSTLSFARMLVDLPAGILVDRFRQKTLLVTGALITAAGGAVSAMAGTYELLLVGQAISGLGLNTCLIAAMVAFSALGDARNRGGMFGLYTAATTISAAVSPVVAGLVTTQLGWQWTFVFASSLAAAAALLASFVLQVPAGQASPHKAAAPAAVADPITADAGTGRSGQPRAAVAIYLVVFLFFLGSSGLSHTAIPLYAGDTMGLDASTIGWVLGVAMLFRTAVSLAGGHLGDAMGYRVILTASLVILGASFIVFNAASGVWGFLAGMLVISLGHTGSALPNAWLVSLSSKEHWGKMLGISRLISDLAHVIGPVTIIAAMEIWGFQGATIASAAVMWIAALVSAFAVKGHRRSAV